MPVIEKTSLLISKKPTQAKPTPSRRTFYALFFPLLLTITGLIWLIAVISQNTNHRSDQEMITTQNPNNRQANRRNRHHQANNSFKLPPFVGCVDPANLAYEENSEPSNLAELLQRTNEQGPIFPQFSLEEITLVRPCSNEGIWEIEAADEYGRATRYFVSLPYSVDQGLSVYALSMGTRKPIVDPNGNIVGFAFPQYHQNPRLIFTSLSGEIIEINLAVEPNFGSDTNNTELFTAENGDLGSFVYSRNEEGLLNIQFHDLDKNVIAIEDPTSAVLELTRNEEVCDGDRQAWNTEAFFDLPISEVETLQTRLRTAMLPVE